MHYQPGVKRIELRKYEEKKLFNEESFIMFIRLIILLLCLFFWYGIYKCFRIFMHWFF